MNNADITVVLDRSGSMSSVKEDTIGGFNQFLEEQKQNKIPTTFTLAQFDDQYNLLHEGIGIGDVKPLTSDTFVPRGNTALHDAIGRTIESTGKRLASMKESDRPSRIVFLIITDGHENASKEFTATRIKEMVTHQREKYNWEFVFLGANQDAVLTGGSLGIAATNSLTYAHNKIGTQKAFASTASNVSDYLCGAAMSASYSSIDRQAQADLLCRPNTGGINQPPSGEGK